MIICASSILPFSARSPLLRNGAIVLSGDVIRAIGPANSISRAYPEHEIIDLGEAVLMPGLVNVHAHLELPPLLDLIRARNFPEWVINLIRLKKNIGRHEYTTAAQQNIDALIRTGTTCVGEISTHEVSSALLDRSGLRAIVYREIISLDPAAKPDHRTTAVRRPTRLVRYGLSPHAPYTVSDVVLRTIRKTAGPRLLPVSMHVAESTDEVKLLLGKRSGFDELYRLAGWDLSWAPLAASPIQHLKQLGLLSPSFLAVHAVHASDTDIALLRRTRTPVAHCPRSNRATRTGKLPLRKFLDAGVVVGLGTDSLASAPSLSMWDEMRAALSLHRRSGVSARDIMAIATFGGARALGLGDITGSLQPGKKADLIAVPLPRRNTGDLFSDLLRETKTCIMCVVNGRILYGR